MLSQARLEAELVEKRAEEEKKYAGCFIICVQLTYALFLQNIFRCFFRKTIEEQERRDRDLAMRVAQDNQAQLVDEIPTSIAVLQQQQR